MNNQEWKVREILSSTAHVIERQVHESCITLHTTITRLSISHESLRESSSSIHDQEAEIIKMTIMTYLSPSPVSSVISRRRES